jgi:tRNA-specific 2-thiouridylase
MSGGVDSSTAAFLLLKQGYEVIGVSMKLPYIGEVSNFGCCGIEGIEDARAVAQKLNIPFYVLNYEEEFEREVIEYFRDTYARGRTPNPCIVCNQRVKFGSLLKKAKSLGAEYLATGHYAQIEYNKVNKKYLLKKGKGREQSYFLFFLTQSQLSQILFPLGKYTKSEVRQLAKDAQLRVHAKPASQEICFIPEGNYRAFLRDKLSPGVIINKEGKVLGKHQGIAFYTIGQRKRLGAHKKPLYVVAIKQKENAIVVGDEGELYQDTLIAEEVNWIEEEEPRYPIKVKARIRYQHPESEAIVEPFGLKKVKVKFTHPQRAPAPGQAVVFYQNDTVVGGGWIC